VKRQAESRMVACALSNRMRFADKQTRERELELKNLEG